MQTIPMINVYDDVEMTEPETHNVWMEIKKILYRIKWCEESIKQGQSGNNDNLQYVTNRVRDLEGFLAVMDGERVRQVSRKYFEKREREGREEAKISHKRWINSEEGKKFAETQGKLRLVGKKSTKRGHLVRPKKVSRGYIPLK